MNCDEFVKSGAFVRFSEDQWLVSWGLLEPKESMREDEIGFYVPDFFKENKSNWASFENNAVYTTGQFQKILETQANPQARSFSEIAKLASLGSGGLSGLKVADWRWSPADKNLFTADFMQTKELFKAGELKKLVPLAWESTDETPTGEQIRRFSHRLLSSHENSYPYGFWSEQSGIMGVTPEVLFNLNSTQLSTMALAGTKLSSNKTSLLDDPKQVFEHEVVADRLQKTFSQFGDVQRGETKQWVIGDLTHLKADIHVPLKSPITFEQAVSVMHPTPALGGEPQKLALKVLMGQESSKLRKRFGAPFGIKIKNELNFCLVAIRNIQWFDKSTYLFSGSGVVPQSQLEDEWQELQNKRDAVKKSLGL